MEKIHHLAELQWMLNMGETMNNAINFAFAQISQALVETHEHC